MKIRCNESFAVFIDADYLITNREGAIVQQEKIKDLLHSYLIKTIPS
jgi:hypothetical protein